MSGRELRELESLSASPRRKRNATKQLGGALPLVQDAAWRSEHG